MSAIARRPCARMCHITKPSPYVFALLATLAAAGGCADTVTGPADAGSPADALSPDAGSPLDVSPTRDAPPTPDTAGPFDAPPDAASCALPDGRRCMVGATCPAGDGCNVCSCRPESSLAACTLIGCLADAGPRRCNRRDDCGSAEFCQFPEAGCAAQGACALAIPCSESQDFCACDGTTYNACAPNRPTARVGRCAAADAGGPPDRCAGAHIGRTGRDCAGPADEALPLDCCAWNCDINTAPCDSLPPRCPTGEVNTVATGGCWGPCVPPRACMPIACDASRPCPPGFRCDAAAGRCVASG